MSRAQARNSTSTNSRADDDDWDPYKESVAPHARRNDPEAFGEIIFGCTTWLVYLLILVLNVYLIALELTVGINAWERNTPCDKPLADYLVYMGALGISILVLQTIHWCWKGCFKNKRLDPSEFSTSVCFLVVLGFVISGIGMGLLIYGNVWVFTSETCEKTSANFVPDPQELMLSLYDAARLSVIACDTIAALLIAGFCCFYFLVHSVERSETLSEAKRRGFLRDATLEYIYTPAGLLYWVSALRANGALCFPATRSSSGYRRVQVADDDV